MGIPMAAFTLAGHQAQGLVSSMGAFTALYLAGASRADRMRVLPPVGAGFVVASLLGVVAAGHVWWTDSCLIVAATLACLLSFSVSLGPPGPMMFVFVTGVSGHMATPTSQGGAGMESATIPLLIAAGALGAYLVVIAPLALPLLPRSGGLPARLRFQSLDPASLIVAGRVVLAVTIASLVAIPFGIGHAYWAVMVAGVVLQVTPSLRYTTMRTVHRVLGTLIGVAAFGLVALLEPAGLVLVILVAGLQGAVEVVVARNYGLGLIFITPLSLAIATAGNVSSVGEVVSDRIIDTLLGATIALAVLAASRWLGHRLAIPALES